MNKFLIANGKSLQWVMALLALVTVIGGFFEKQGCVVFDSPTFELINTSIRGAILLFVLFRLIRPRDQQDLQALMILMVMPFSGDIYTGLASLVALCVTLLCRWHLLARIVGLSAMALCVFVMPKLLVPGCSIGTDGIPNSPSKGIFVSKTDDIYFLYRYWYNNWLWQRLGSVRVKEQTYGLFKVVSIFPGLSLVKRIDYINSKTDPIVCRTPEGNYTIVDEVPQ